MKIKQSPGNAMAGCRGAVFMSMAAAAVVMVAGCGGDGGGTDAAPTVSQLRATCGALAGKTVAGVRVTSARRVEAAAGIVDAGFCQVSGTRAPYLDIEVDVPDNWSGRLWHQGGSGFDGKIPSAVTNDGAGAVAAVSPALAGKAAIYAASNGGNRASVPAEAAPGVWASGTPEGEASAVDYAYLALDTTVHFAKALSAEFFGKSPTRSYFNGCSNGGRNAYIAAQRLGGEYDGIVSGCETMDMGSQTAAWLNVGSRAGTPAALTADQYKAAHAAAVAACDELDGLKDGVIANPQACTFSPAALQCGAPGASADPALCLSAAQVGTLASMLSDLKLSDGTLIYSHYSWADFSAFGPSFGALGGGFALLGTGDAAWLTTAGQNAFAPDTDYPLIAAGLQRIGADHDKAAIAAWVASGKKLISWHAGQDNLLSANDHVRNYTTMLGIARSKGLADTAAATRFFIVPGATHGKGSTLQEVDWASAIMDWVEKGTAPQQLTYTFKSGDTTRSMPVCQYPAFPRYNGTGNPDSAGSFSCS